MNDPNPADPAENRIAIAIAGEIPIRIVRTLFEKKSTYSEKKNSRQLLLSVGGIGIIERFNYTGIDSPTRETTGMKVDESIANLEICGRFCGSCPTYQENALKTGTPSLLFCARGNSDKGRGEKMAGCNCPGCGVHKRYKLAGDYFCTK